MDLAERLGLPEGTLLKEKDGKYLVLNPDVPSWLVTNQAGVVLLRLLDGSRTLQQALEEVQRIDPLVAEPDFADFVERAREARLFESGRPALSPPRFPLRSLYLNVTEACNLRCSYCYAEERVRSPRGQQLQLHEYLEVLEGARRLSSDLVVHFTGGEPLKSGILFDLADHCRSLGFGTYLLTNGTQIHPDNVERIAQLFGDLKISLDGASPEVNDATRGPGSYEAIMAGLALLDEAGKPYRVCMTVTRRNLDHLPAMVERFGSRLQLAPYFPRKDSILNQDLAITGAEYFEAMTRVVGVNPYREIDQVLETHSRRGTIQRCAMADGTLSVAANGDVYPCQLLHFPEFHAGNVRETPFEEIYRGSVVLERMRLHTVRSMEGCRDCPISLLCGGGCLARHYYENGTLQVAGRFCEYEQLAIPEALLDRHAL